MSPARRTLPLATGEYVSKNADDSILTWNVRLRLLWAIERQYPTLLDSLAADVLPAFRRSAHQYYRTIGFSVFSLPLFPYRELAQQQDPALKELRNAVDAWAIKNHANFEWLKDEALRAVKQWHENPGSLKARKWKPEQERYLSTVSAPDLTFQSIGWDLEAQGWSEYRNSARQQFERALDNYKTLADELAAARGLVPVPKKYQPKHLDWLVWYQFGGLSYTKVADRFGIPEESTVRRGIEIAVDLVGIPRRRKNRKIR